jgi:hypothetical protein
MGKSLLCRLGIAQISFNPAYVDQLVSNIQEPVFPGKEEKVGLFTLAGLEEVNKLRHEIAEQYIRHLNAKLEAFVRFAASRSVELVVFPEYSIPPESLPICRRLSDGLNIAIVAGTHVVTVNPAALRIYKELQLLSDDSFGSFHPDQDIRKAICVVFVPNQTPVAFPKHVRSKKESSLVPGQPELHSFKMATKAGPIEAQVLICIEALADFDGVNRKKYRQGLIVIPAFTPTSEPFYKRANLDLLQSKCTLFANVAEFGGSRAIARAENASLWFTQEDGTSEIPAPSEALLIIEADLEKQFEVRKTTTDYRAVTDVAVFPALYQMDSPECAKYVELTQGRMSSVGDIESLSKTVQPFTNLSDKVFPRLLKQKLQHFVSQIVPSGAVNCEEAKEWIEPLLITETPSTNVLRWELCSRAIETINSLQVSGKHIEKSKEMMEVYGHLVAKRNELISIIEPDRRREVAAGQLPEAQVSPVPAVSPFIDRQPTFDRITNFINQPQEIAFVLSGMKGIGKSSLVQEAFRQVIPPRKTIWLQLTEGTAYPRLLAELAYKCNLRLLDDLDFSRDDKQEGIEQRILSSLAHEPGAIVVFDEFQSLLSPLGEIESNQIRQLLRKLIGGSSKNKFFLISHIVPKLGADIESRCSFYSLRGLETSDTRRLLLYWFQFGRDDLAGRLPSPSDRFVSLLGGHPPRNQDCRPFLG